MDDQPDVLQEILQWAKTILTWQSDALRRLITTGEITVPDKNQILQMALAAHGVSEEGCPKPRPLASDDLPSRPDPAKVPVLCGMKEVKNVNALLPNQVLTFGIEGLTLIYGENASGKSGYSRVLKRACRARHAEKVLPNVLASPLAASPPEAVFDILPERKAKGRKALQWREGTATPPEMAQFAVFDGHCARVYLTEANEVAYIPYGLDVFPKLADLLDQLKAEVEPKILELKHRDTVLDDLAGNTAVGRLVAGLSTSTDLEEAKHLSTLSESESEELQRLKQRVSEPDPGSKAKAIRRLKNRIEVLLDGLQQVQVSLGEEAIAALQAAWQQARTLEEAAALASSKTFDQEPLPAVGSTAWREMFRAAREYSVQDAYPGISFPMIEEGARCVLCMQLLEEDAKLRLARFQQFVEDTTAKRAEEAKKVYEQLLGKVRLIQIQKVEKTLEEEIRECNPLVVDALAKLTSTAKSRREMGLESASSGVWKELAAFEPDNERTITTFIDSLEAEARVLDESADAAKSEEWRSRYEELAAREKLSTHLQTVLRYVENLRRAERFDQLVRELNSQPISMRGRDIAARVLSSTLESALRRELDYLGIHHLNLDFQHMVRKGRSHHQLQLADAGQPCNMTDVLSEGEQRVISVASFLAELSLSPVKAGIIFDDPVSSLDHKWRERIAKRLVEEAKSRQVIVFTHDITFFLAAIDEAAMRQIPCFWQSVTRCGGRVGVCAGEVAWEALDAKGKLRELTTILLEARQAFEQDPQGGTFCVLHDQFYDYLRATWERVVEEKLLQGVVKRFEHAVKTQQLNAVSVEDDDYRIVYWAMKQTSARIPAHNHAPAYGHDRAGPEQMEGDLHELKTFAQKLDKKAEEVRERRKKLTKPSAGDSVDSA